MECWCVVNVGVSGGEDPFAAVSTNARVAAAGMFLKVRQVKNGSICTSLNAMDQLLNRSIFFFNLTL